MNELLENILTIVAAFSGLICGLTERALHDNLDYLAKKMFLGKKFTGKNRQPSKKPIGSWLLFLTSGLLTLFLVSFATLFQLITPNKEPMTGDFRVIFADFALNSTQVSIEDQHEISATTYRRIDAALDSMETDFSITRWGPEELKAKRLNAIIGIDPETRATQAKALADLVQADLIVYGSIEEEEKEILVKPEFYMRVQNSYEAEEIIGQYDLGEPIKIKSMKDVTDRMSLNKQLSSRSEALSRIILGLAHYKHRDYRQALIQFQEGEKIDDWKPEQGQHVLYQMAANAVIRQEEPDLDLAEIYFKKSLEVKPDYARAMIGLANVYYRRALLPMEATNQKSDIDTIYLEKAIALLNEAMVSPNQSPLADVPVKVHFELGQINFMLTYCGKQSGYDVAIREFRMVVNIYNTYGNERLKELAGEAHARLGLIAYHSGNISEAITEYQVAADILVDYPERRAIYEERIQDFKQGK